MNAAARHVSVGLVLVLAAACQGAQVASPTASLPTVSPGASPTLTQASATPAPTTTSQPTPVPSAEPTPIATATATAAPSPSPTLLPTASPTPAPAGLVIDWRQRGGDHGFGTLFDDSQRPTLHSGAVFANRFFIAGAQTDIYEDDFPAVWSSVDGLTWEMAELPTNGRILATATNGSVLLVSTETTPLLLTTNGTDWELVVDADVEYVSTMTSWAGGFVAFGSAALISADGRDWQPVASESATNLAATVVVKVFAHGDRLVAITGGADSYNSGPLALWTSTDGQEWTKIGSLPGTRRVTTPVIAAGPLGWVMTGSDLDADIRNYMWWSADGLTWQEVTAPVGPVSDLLADDLGFVAVGFLFVGTGCALDPWDIQGLSWTSLDGRSWTVMPQDDFLYQRIDHLFRDGRTLIGVGLIYDPEEGVHNNGGVWTGRLPPLAPVGPGPTPAPTPTPDPGGCGPG